MAADRNFLLAYLLRTVPLCASVLERAVISPCTIDLTHLKTVPVIVLVQLTAGWGFNNFYCELETVCIVYKYLGFVQL